MSRRISPLRSALRIQNVKIHKQKNDTFKVQITLVRDNARLKVNEYLLPDPPHFSLGTVYQGCGTAFFVSGSSILG
jgi:hypothetical protein